MAYKCTTTKTNMYYYDNKPKVFWNGKEYFIIEHTRSRIGDQYKDRVKLEGVTGEDLYTVTIEFDSGNYNKIFESFEQCFNNKLLL